uniref:Uncharacterized protein n=1 Tax=Sphaerodactylus townsendi TaxID=933632 RepID=A0ACB8FRY7_9SAUR
MGKAKIPSTAKGFNHQADLSLPMPIADNFSLSDKEGRKVDILRSKLYSNSALDLCVSNYMAIMDRYHVFVWDKLSQHISDFLEDMKPLVKRLQAEEINVECQKLNTTCFVVDITDKCVAGVVVLHCHSWLRVSALPHNTRDLPLFNEQTDPTLSRICKNYTIASRSDHPLGRILVGIALTTICMITVAELPRENNLIHQSTYLTPMRVCYHAGRKRHYLSDTPTDSVHCQTDLSLREASFKPILNKEVGKIILYQRSGLPKLIMIPK